MRKIRLPGPSPARDLGVLTSLIERFFFLLQYLSIANILFRTRQQSQDSARTPEQQHEEFFKRSRQIELYVATVLVLEILAFGLVVGTARWLAISAVVFVCWRVVDLFQLSINISILDHIRVSGRTHYFASSVRMVLLGLLNFGEAILCFAVIYAFSIESLSGATGRRDALYFSVITQLTVGYGDLRPTGALRYVVASQALLGFVLAVVLIARLIALLPPLQDFSEAERKDSGQRADS